MEYAFTVCLIRASGGYTHTHRTHTHFIPTVYLCIYRLNRIKENGQERTEIEEDGVLKSVLINGKITHNAVCDWGKKIFINQQINKF